MKKFIEKFKELSSETKAGLALALGTTIIIISALAFSGFSSSNSSSSSYIENSNNISLNSEDNNSQTEVVDVMKEEIIRPYVGEMNTIHHFYDKDEPVEIRVKSIVKVEGATSTYIKSLGNDFAKSNNEQFNVIASVSGTVVDKLSDSTYGNVLVIEHKSGIKTIYASLDNMKVNKGEEVKQGDVIATSGSSLYLKNHPSALHFEILKDDKNINPENVFSKSIKEI